MKLFRNALVGLGFATLVGCAAAASDGTATSGSSVMNGSDNAAASDGTASGTALTKEETCTATFRWLQKDAYKNTGGRTDQAWPPHTTTEVDVRCADADGNETFTQTAFRENHGTSPGQLDPNGRVYLDEVKNEIVTAPRTTLVAFLGSYKECECAPETTFLSLDSVKGDTENQILGQVSQYMQAHLKCTGDTTTDAIVGMVQNGDYTGALAALNDCAWDEGYGWEDAFKQSAQSVLSTLSDYHVCNNDAQLQAQAWSTLKTTGEVAACDNTGAVCHGPAFFYNP